MTKNTTTRQGREREDTSPNAGPDGSSTEAERTRMRTESPAERQAHPEVGEERTGAGTNEREPQGDALEAEKAKAAEYLAQWQRTAADFANYKRRVEQDRSEMAKLFNLALVSQLLPVLDNFERALATAPAELKDHTWIEGVTLTEKQLRAALEKEGLSPIEALGQKFDPNLHEAVANADSADHEEDTVIEEFQRGYKLHDRVIRPSMVKVSRRS